MGSFKQNAVSRAIWPWMDREAEKPGPSRLKLLVAALAAWAVAGVLYLWWNHRVMAIAVVVISSATLIGGLWIPPLYDRMQQGFRLLGRAVGQTLTYVLLVPFFYLVFPFARLVLRLQGKDPMQRLFPSDQPSYWVDRPAGEDREALRRQG